MGEFSQARTGRRRVPFVVMLHARVLCRGKGIQLLLKGTSAGGEELCVVEVSVRNGQDVLERKFLERLGREVEALQFLRPDGKDIGRGLRLREAWMAVHDGSREFGHRDISEGAGLL